jgi:hypothetical protein
MQGLNKMARAQRADEERSLSPAEYFKKYCVDEKIGDDLTIIESADYLKSREETIDNNVNYSVVNYTVEKNKPLRQTKEFQRHASENQWSTRRERGFPWRYNIFDFLRDVYSDWVERGMTQADLKNVDADAYRALRSRLDGKKEAFPDDFYIPTSREAALDRCETQEERERLLIVREYERERNVRRGLVPS